MLHQMLFHKHLEEDEHMVLIVHRHWLFGVRGLLLPTLLFVLSLAALLPYHTRGAMVILGCTVLISAVWVVHNFLDYFLDAWLVTDHGVIDLEWMGWFHRQSSRILYSDIQGVSYEIHGVLGTLLRYGTVAVEKISTGSAVSLANVSHPRRVESTILACMETYLHSKNLSKVFLAWMLCSCVSGGISMRQLSIRVRISR